MLPVIVLLAIIAIVFLLIAGLVVWLTGLLTAVLFSIITVLILYAFHELEMIDIHQDRWLLFTPFIMFFAGLGLDKVGVLQIQPLSLSALTANPLSVLTISLSNILGICQECGKKVSWEEYQADHIRAYIKAGKTTIENGQVLCSTCNARKGAT